MNIKERLSAFLHLIRRENLHRLFLILIILIIISAAGLAIFEPNTSLTNALWWSIVTLTTVGYGDITPSTVYGRIIGIIIMFFGIGILGMFTATIASIFVEQKLKEEKGMKSYDLENHIILCQWNFRASEILQEFRSDPRTKNTPVALIANIASKPVDDNQLYFIQGNVTEENLARANLQKASTVVILGDDNLEPNAKDAQVILATLTVESINPNVYTIVELVNENNVRHCERAHADEIIVGTEFSSRLIARSTLDHGISKVLSELLSSKYGNDLNKIPVTSLQVGHSFFEVFTEMKRKDNCIVLAVQKGKEGKVISNPAGDYILEEEDYLIIISQKH